MQSLIAKIFRHRDGRVDAGLTRRHRHVGRVGDDDRALHEGPPGARIFELRQFIEHFRHFVAALAAADVYDDIGIAPLGQGFLQYGLLLHPADRLVVGVLAGRRHPAHRTCTDARRNQTQLLPRRGNSADRLAGHRSISRVHRGLEAETVRLLGPRTRPDERLVRAGQRAQQSVENMAKHSRAERDGQRLAAPGHPIARLEPRGVLIDLRHEFIRPQFDDLTQQRARPDGNRLVHVEDIRRAGTQHGPADPVYSRLRHADLSSRCSGADASAR